MTVGCDWGIVEPRFAREPLETPPQCMPGSCRRGAVEFIRPTRRQDGRGARSIFKPLPIDVVVDRSRSSRLFAPR